MFWITSLMLNMTLRTGLAEILMQLFLWLYFCTQSSFAFSLGVHYETLQSQLKYESDSNYHYVAMIVHDLKNPVKCLQEFFEYLMYQ